jgi:hypothetical protein
MVTASVEAPRAASHSDRSLAICYEEFLEVSTVVDGDDVAVPVSIDVDATDAGEGWGEPQKPWNVQGLAEVKVDHFSVGDRNEGARGSVEQSVEGANDGRCGGQDRLGAGLEDEVRYLPEFGDLQRCVTHSLSQWRCSFMSQR